VYDALGRRAERNVGTIKTDYVYDLSGHVVTDFNNVCAPVCWARSYIYLNGQQIAEYGNSTTYFVHKDHLGSTRVVTGVNQSIADNLDYLPFGEQISGASVTSHKFTSDERDSETTLDHTWFRQYSPLLGRWITPDPFAGYIDNPQSLNRYAYVLNGPMTFTDPLGLVCGDEPNMPCNQGNSGGGGGSGSFAGYGPFGLMMVGATSQDEIVGWQLIGVDNGLIMLGGCNGSPDCFYSEIPIIDTVSTYPSIGLVPSVPGTSGGGGGGGANPRLRPPTNQEYAACTQRAGANRDQVITNARIAQVVGGLSIELAIFANAQTIPALNGVFFKNGVEGAIDFAHAGGIAYAGSLATFIPGYLYVRGTIDVAKAWDQYNEDMANCAGAVRVP
jgi:RHS repeat-associated protein